MNIDSKPRGRRTTLKDIAKRLDVSHGTVSRALNRPEDPMISEATRERVQRVALEMGYRPNHAARSLATGRTGLVALWLWTEAQSTSYHAHVSQVMHAEAQRRSYQLLVNLVGWKALAPRQKNHFDDWHVDGIISHEAGPSIQAQFQGSNRPPVPVVCTGVYHFLPGADNVRIDVSAGALQGMKHLLELGRRKIVYVTDELSSRQADPRFLAYTGQLDEAGMEPRFLEVPSDRAGVREAVRRHFAGSREPDALFCHNDDMAIAAYRALCDLGIRVPDDIALMGCDGIDDLEYLEVPITTIVQPFSIMCAIATEFLEHRINDPSRPIQEAMLSANLVVRSSTGGAPT